VTTVIAATPVIAIRVMTIAAIQDGRALRGAMVMVMEEATAVPAGAVDEVTVEAVAVAMVVADIGR